MYLYGASGHCKVIIDILEDCGITVEGLYDDNASFQEFNSYPLSKPLNVKGPLIISIGNNGVRKKLAELLDIEFGRAIHPSAIVSTNSVIELGTVVMQGAVIQAQAHLGKHCIVNTAASIDHDCKIGDYVHISPNATLCGNVSVGEGTWIGAGSVVIPGVKIGRWSIIGAGSVVIRDIPDNVVAFGNPCAIIKTIR